MLDCPSLPDDVLDLVLVNLGSWERVVAVGRVSRQWLASTRRVAASLASSPSISLPHYPALQSLASLLPHTLPTPFSLSRLAALELRAHALRDPTPLAALLAAAPSLRRLALTSCKRKKDGSTWRVPEVVALATALRSAAMRSPQALATLSEIHAPNISPIEYTPEARNPARNHPPLQVGCQKRRRVGGALPELRYRAGRPVAPVALHMAVVAMVWAAAPNNLTKCRIGELTEVRKRPGDHGLIDVLHRESSGAPVVLTTQELATVGTASAQSLSEVLSWNFQSWHAAFRRVCFQNDVD